MLSLPEKNHPRTSSVVVHFIGANATYLTAERLVLLMDIADAIITKPGQATSIAHKNPTLTVGSGHLKLV